MMRKHYYSILVLLLCVFLSHPTFAAKCVKPNGAGPCYDNIQDAIDAVNPGGTVQIFPGIYYESIDANKPGITIVGMGNKRTDVRIASEGHSNMINAGNVTIKKLTIQNGFHGFYISSLGSNSKILNVNIFNSENEGIRIDGATDILIKNCKILKSGEYGVDNEGDRLTVQNTTISDCHYGVFCTGDDLMVDGCTINNSESDLIHVEGSQATIHNNQLFKAGRSGIYVVSDSVKMTENVVKGTASRGIYLEGEAPTIKKNTVMHAQDSGFYLNSTGGESKVVNNQSSYNDGDGFYISSPSFLLFKKNKAFNNDIIGFRFFGTGDKMIIENQSRYNTSGGFSVAENDTLENNIASENGTSGYWLTYGNTATQNKALNNMTAGFFFNGDDNLVRGNRAIGNLNNGIHVAGNDNDIINNTMLDSLYDKCDEGTLGTNTWTNNTYDTECP